LINYFTIPKKEADFDLATTIKGAGYYRRTRKTDFVSDYLPPTPDEFQQAINHDRYHYKKRYRNPMKLPPDRLSL